MDPTQLRAALEQRLERSKHQEKDARRASDPGLTLIHRARQGAFKEAIAILDKLTIPQP